LKRAVIISGVRTPVGRYMGTLKEIPAYDLGALVLNEAIKRAKVDPAQVGEVILGQSYQSGEYVNIARMSLLKAGWPDLIPGITLDRRCCTGLDVVCFAAMEIQTENAEIVVAGGVETMSNAEFYVPGDIKWGIGGKKGMPRGHGDLSIWGIPFYDRIQRARVMSQPEERFGILPSMMSWAETAAKEEGIRREDCDQWALGSHKKACAAIESGKFREEIVKPLAYIKAFAVAGSDPRRTYLTVPKAVEKVMEKSGLSLNQMDLIEIQEAFAAQVLADLKMMSLTEKDYPRINVNGSGISLGHPIACTGTRVLVTLLHEMGRRNSRYGLECICGGGGLGIAAVFERI
jgi:acetyl-CoA acetyltransferase